ncbi:uncharacterized protein LOC116188837 [Punica granatum]|uniref:Uncharacterized protein LOC116188837 n=1 Tax=Punica granatum TaxID=22663 RepID=A0A6P8BV33_PUNGR|nr:uncharacterized protein LOC116188837 [Punica granatum]
MYICFDASKRGLLAGCRPLIGLDGCFLKGYYGGTLLAAVTQDPTHAFYVIAYGVVERETKDNWSWLLRMLLEDIGDPREHGWEFISDMQKFNAAIVKYRARPIINMLEEIGLYLMRKMNSNRNQIARYRGPITPTAQSKLEIAKRDSHKWHALWARDPELAKFQVQHIYSSNHQHVVDLKMSTCSCREWDLCGIPCKHAVACMHSVGIDAEKHVNPCHSRETWDRIYAPYIAPLRGKDQWMKSSAKPVEAPRFAKGNDVPQNPYKFKRKYKEIQCGRCGEREHNVKRCKGTLSNDKQRKKAKTDTSPQNASAL